MKKTTLAAIILALPIAAAARGVKPILPPPEPNQKIVQADRTDEPIVLDGRLDEKVWKNAPANGFTQNDPKDGDPSTEKTDVWVAYDDKALYVAAFCHDSDPKGIIGLLGRRRFPGRFRLVHVRRRSLLRQADGLPLRASIRPARSWTKPCRTTSTTTHPGTASGNGRPPSTATAGSSRCGSPSTRSASPNRDEYVWGVNFTRVIKRKNETGLLRLGAEERAGLRLEVRPAGGHPGHQPRNPRRDHALRHRAGPVPARRARQSVRDGAQDASATSASTSRSASRAT